MSKQIPNCKVCEWRIDQELNSLLSAFKIPTISRCGAQGNKHIEECWNSRQCRQLFKDSRDAITSK